MLRYSNGSRMSYYTLYGEQILDVKILSLTLLLSRNFRSKNPKQKIQRKKRIEFELDSYKSTQGKLRFAFTK
ncbi:hypothetical protein LEP1GSC036_0029 [Leptospira weilii str. 2006001853]|uniref:Uncharacterized protein n=3 Tax=Leptospira weilii TaxID=28184 RepID=A0A828YWC9_9LEPT|nr:hypothetical protein LEP1GSC036_0029 [Leptospira weilii str. 2006001853]EMJ66163.1 hypothetical protein LEP1GSC051_1235 [Leptospira sp. P2653]EMM72610.1 hypothetical protein LEP1GSC038_1857 [Leptospira weilii str. 2006001855]EMN43812.1 hypothetical protein LEP1GSC086_4604 [Leptospira weilii str. LNT 1234]EMN91618.1 hypothetical protein LEP1GSC108_4951 [Leptospira weilii str. UI 13098]OMI16970.1 hypothetical protein BUQ74_12775 [Leptospira weilii serovar Heyan]QDK21707.1 hypothetical protei